MKLGSVILVETNGADPETTTELRGSGVSVISIDWDEVARGDDPQYILDILDRIDELGVRDTSPVNHIGMPAVRRQLKERLAELQTCPWSATSDSECSMYRERSVAGVSDTVPDCPAHGAFLDAES